MLFRSARPRAVDPAKDKWFHNWNWKIDGPWAGGHKDRPRRTREWPRRVWKHYYAAPAAVWRAGVPAELPPASGLLSLEPWTDDYGDNRVLVHCLRRARPNTKADRISAEDAIDIARLASLRMWDALAAVDARQQVSV